MRHHRTSPSPDRCYSTGFNETCADLDRARGTCFATLVIVLMVHAVTCKHVNRSILSMNLLDNKVSRGGAEFADIWQLLLGSALSLALTVRSMPLTSSLTSQTFGIIYMCATSLRENPS